MEFEQGQIVEYLNPTPMGYTAILNEATGYYGLWEGNPAYYLKGELGVVVIQEGKKVWVEPEGYQNFAIVDNASAFSLTDRRMKLWPYEVRANQLLD